jgi:hypothetical protein
MRYSKPVAVDVDIDVNFRRYERGELVVIEGTTA